MRNFRLSRRAVLRGTGGIAIALPWLEIMEPERSARAQAGAPAKRFLAVYTPGGNVIDDGSPSEWAPNANHRDLWSPTGLADAPVLSPILAPLEPVKSKLLPVGGLSMQCAKGEQHQCGIIGWLTGTQQEGPENNWSKGASIDQVIAGQISLGKKAKASLEMAVRWATGGSNGQLSPINVANFQENATWDPIPPRLDPMKIYDELFSNLDPAASAGSQSRFERKKSILDFLDENYSALVPRLGATDRQKVEEHLTKIREMEQSLLALGNAGGGCMAPERIDTSDYQPTIGSAMNASTDAAIPKVGQLMMDMMVMALACDITAVGTLQWTDTEAKHTFPWLGLTEHHHFYQHDGGFRPVECQRICTWYSEQHAYLLQKMDQIDMGGHTLLDESVVFFGSELGDPPSHNKGNMPFMLAGGGGGMRGGRFLKYNGQPHNNLLVSILNLFGDTRTSFGDPRHCTGALPGLT